MLQHFKENWATTLHILWAGGVKPAFIIITSQLIFFNKWLFLTVIIRYLFRKSDITISNKYDIEPDTVVLNVNTIFKLKIVIYTE